MDTMIGYWVGCWKKYADFTGRARRSEYWYFTLVNFLISLAGQFTIGLVLPWFWWFLSFGFSAALLLPSLAVGARRLHDSGKSGLFLLFYLLPFAGLIVLLVLFCLDSTPGENEYGPNPKESAGERHD